MHPGINWGFQSWLRLIEGILPKGARVNLANSVVYGRNRSVFSYT